MITERKNLSVFSNSVEETEEMGAGLAGLLKSGDLVVLTGPLGAGKTCFIRGLARGLGVPDDEIKSPSFTILYEYRGRLPFYHFDLYRLEKPSELYHTGWDEYLLREGIIAVEWGEKAGELLPDSRIDVRMDIQSDSRRQISIVFIK